jgi:hypothetical protein
MAARYDAGCHVAVSSFSATLHHVRSASRHAPMQIIR